VLVRMLLVLLLLLLLWRLLLLSLHSCLCAASFSYLLEGLTQLRQEGQLVLLADSWQRGSHLGCHNLRGAGVEICWRTEATRSS
jgi:hypothetical protein